MLKYNSNYDNTAIIGNKKIKFKPWTTKNEKDYLIAVESEENINDSMLFDILVKPCLEDPNIILSTNEQKMLIIEIRKKSIGPTFSMNFSCPKCKQVNDIDIEFDNIIKYKPENFGKVKSNNIEFEFGPIVSENLKKRLEGQENSVEYSFIELLIHIHSITINGTKEENFSFDELNSFMEEIPSNIFDDVFRKFTEMKGSLNFKYKTKCLICNEESDLDFDYIPGFLWR